VPPWCGTAAATGDFLARSVWRILRIHHMPTPEFKGGGKRSSFGGIDFPKTKSLENSAGHASFSFQNLIETGAFDATTPRKSDLISLTLNRRSQQLNNFIIIKYERVTT
jgi:hypothetical protein